MKRRVASSEIRPRSMLGWAEKLRGQALRRRRELEVGEVAAHPLVAGVRFAAHRPAPAISAPW